MRIAYIGLGNLGGHLAMSLIRNGFETVVYDRNPALAARHREAGASVAGSAGEAAHEADVIMTCLPSPAVSEAVLDEILPVVRQDAIWIENSTLGRDDVQRLGKKAESSGLRVLEAPVTGGVHLAAQGNITVLVGGETALFNSMHPVFQAIGNQIFHMGPLGSAAIIKVITNMLAFIHLKADAEALMLAKRGGLDLGQAWHAIKASSGNSFVHETEGALILNGSYDIAFNMDLALKDLGFAMQFGREFGVPLELAGATQQTYVAAKAAYGGHAESPMIAKLLEDLLKTDLRAPGFPARLE